MRERFAIRPLPLGLGLVAVLVGAAGLGGVLDVRTLDSGWLMPGLVAAAGLAIASAGLLRR